MADNKNKKKKKNGAFGTVIIILFIAAGLGIMLYPTLSDWINSKHQSRAIAVYDKTVDEMDEKDFTEMFESAEKFNRRILDLGSSYCLTHPEKLTGYEDILNISGTGIMGYVTIDKINVQISIYHGTDSTVLQVGAGHLKGSSIPIGGESTKSVISAHRGLPSAKLFTDLDKLQKGDRFTVTVLNSVLVYEVDEIYVIMPDEMQNLYVEDGKDLCALLTCTPYGINDHRLLVIGKRIHSDDSSYIRVSSDGSIVDPILESLIIASPGLLILAVWLTIKLKKVKSAENQNNSSKTLKKET